MTQDTDSKERLTLTVPEAARQLGIAPGTAYELCRTGAIPSLRFGKKVVVPRRAIERMLDSACAGATS